MQLWKYLFKENSQRTLMYRDILKFQKTLPKINIIYIAFQNTESKLHTLKITELPWGCFYVFSKNTIWMLSRYFSPFNFIILFILMMMDKRHLNNKICQNQIQLMYLKVQLPANFIIIYSPSEPSINDVFILLTFSFLRLSFFFSCCAI